MQTITRLSAAAVTILFTALLLCSCQPRSPKFISIYPASRICGCAGSLHEFRVVNVEWTDDRKYGWVQIMADDSSRYIGVVPLPRGQVNQITSWAAEGRQFDTKACEFDKNWKSHPRRYKDSIRRITAYYSCPDYSPAICKLEDGTIVKFHFSNLSQYHYISHSFVTNCDYNKATGKFVPHRPQLW